MATLLCSHCGIGIEPHESYGSAGRPICQFCTYFGDSGGGSGFAPESYGQEEPDADLANAVISALNSFTYASNAEEKDKQRPAQIMIYKDDVNDVIKMNGFAKDILDVAIRQFPKGSAEAFTISVIEGQLNSFNEDILAKAKRMETGLRTTPILFSKVESDALYKILDMVHKLYGKFFVAWFRTKAKKDWPAWRKIFYENAWHLGSFCRHGRPAKSPSPWLIGQRPPLEDDPFGSTPIGQEK